MTFLNWRVFAPLMGFNSLKTKNLLWRRCTASTFRSVIRNLQKHCPQKKKHSNCSQKRRLSLKKSALNSNNEL